MEKGKSNYELFREFDSAIEKGKLVEEREHGPDENPKRVLQIYKLGDLTIARDTHTLKTIHSHRTSFAVNEYEHYPSTEDRHFYYLFRNGSQLITDKNEIKENIKRVAGIELPKIDTRTHEKYHSREPGDSDPNDSFSLIVKGVGKFKGKEKVIQWDYQPTESRLIKEAFLIKKSLEELLPAEIGFRTLDELVSNAKKVHELATEFSKGYKEPKTPVESALESWKDSKNN